MEFFIGLLIGITACVIATIPAEKDYGQLMYRRGYSGALEDIQRKNKWTPITEKLPEDDRYILVSFNNATMIDIARYEKDDEGGAFYPGDDEESYSRYGIFVNAWMELPEAYRGEWEQCS